MRLPVMWLFSSRLRTGKAKTFTLLNTKGSGLQTKSLTGFTLIELLVVIAIISVLTSLTIVVLGSIRTKSRDVKRVGDIRQLQSVLDAYFNDNNSYPSAITAGNTIVGPNGITYMDRVPAPPGTPDGSCATDTYAYSLVDANTYNIVYCLGNAVQNVGAGRWAAVPGNMTGTPPPIAGDSYQGGVVAYIFQAGDTGYVEGETHGLISATSDLANGQWGCYGTAITGADGTAIGTGNQNTIDITTDCVTAGIAAKLCNDLSLNNYSDWYLPSKDELNKLYIKRVAIGSFLNDGNSYWSSSESQIFTTTGVLTQSFGSGGQDVGDKNVATRHVRCTRTF
jgi:prepilin-type N-terminal cleavage/methylation domain-containing protein